MSEVRVRIAPSPTGDPHVGTAYIALFNYCFAKSQGGKFILRIEDTDQTRSTKESEAAIFRAIRWVGLPYDEGPDVGGPYGPYRQSERTQIYQEHAEILLSRGTAYRCFCTEQDLAKSREASEERTKRHNEFIKGVLKEVEAPLKKLAFKDFVMSAGEIKKLAAKLGIAPEDEQKLKEAVAAETSKIRSAKAPTPEDEQKIFAAAERVAKETSIPQDDGEAPADYFTRARSIVSFIGYDRTCRRLSKDASEARAKNGEKFVIRLAMPETGKTIVKDRLRGDVSFWNLQIDDQVLMKSDGFPTYHLANVVDDHLMKISHVIRAEEWISSTPKHVALYAAFGWEAPQWIHMPLLRNKDKAKISKRKNPVSLDYYRDAGILPEALRNFLGLMGWSISGDREKFTLDEMLDKFKLDGQGIDAIHLGGPVFDLEKLWSLNGLYIREIANVTTEGHVSTVHNPDALLDRLLEWRLGRDFLRRLIPLVAARMETLNDFIPATEFFFAGDLNVKALAESAIPKGSTAHETSEFLLAYAEILDIQRNFVAAEIETATRDFCEKRSLDPKVFFMALRVTLTGRTATPPLFESMEALGKELTRRRLRTMVEQLSERAKKEDEAAKKTAPPKA